MTAIARTGSVFALATVTAALAACSSSQHPAAAAPAAPAAPPALAASPAVAHAAVVRAPKPRAVPGEYLVKFRTPTDRSYAKAMLRAQAFEVRRSYASVPLLHLVRAGVGASAARAAAALARDPSVEYVEPNFYVHAEVVPNDPEFSKLWGLQNTGQTGGSSTANPDIGAVAAWDITTGSANVVVAVIDTGIDYTHVDLAANMWSNPGECSKDGLDNDNDGYIDDCHGINAITGSGDPMDDSFHGTHVSGSIGAVGNNAIGVTGVNWTVSLMACKFLDSSGSGNNGDAITCLDYVALQKDRGVNIVATNNSWGGGAYSQALLDAIVAQRQRGILFVAAAGNNGTDNDQLPSYPCSFDVANIICVASAYDALSMFSDYGTGTVHLAAPGEAIWSTVPNNGYDAHDGTSMATAYATGAVALLAAQDPTRDWRQLKNLLLAGAVPPVQGTIPSVTGGRVNVARSMTCSNYTVEARLRPPTFETITLAVGAQLPLEAININCANPAGPVVVNVAPSGETVTLLDDGTGADQVAGDGIYSGTWTAAAPGTYTLTFPGRAGDVVTVEVDPLLRPGFPERTYQMPDLNGNVGTANAPLIVGRIVAGTSQQILVPGVVGGPLYAWNADGKPLSGWPNWDVNDVAEVSLGELDGNPASAEVIASFMLDGLHAYAGDGSPLAGWPQPTTNVWYPPPTVDVDGDGRDEVIGYPARRADGTVLNPSLSIPVMAPNDGFEGPVAVADLDADGTPDFVLADLTNIYASNANGLLPGFPVPTPNASAGGLIFPVIGDVTGDGTPKIIVPTVSWSGGAGYLNINIFSNTGILLRTLWTTEAVTNAIVALADLDGDGIPEIIASTGTTVYAWKGDGSTVPGWPVSLGSGTIAGPVAVGDVDGDGYPDVVLLSATYINAANPRLGLLHALSRSGKPLAGFPKTIQSVVWGGTPAIADLDGDGRNALIVVHNADFGLRDNVFAYNLKATGPYGPIEWGQYMEGASHRGYYELGKNLPNDAFLTTQAHGAGSIASADGQIQCGSSCIHRYAKGTSVQLTAAPAAGATFSRWLGPCAGQGNPCTVTVARYTPVAADFASPLSVAITGNFGTVTSSPAGISCPGTCTANFPARTIVTLTATPSSGNAFDGWTGTCSGLSSSCAIVIDGAHSVGAHFVDHWVLTLAPTGAGTASFTSSPAGINCNPACSGGFPPGASVTLTATPAADSYVADWGIDYCHNSGLSCTLTLNSDVTVPVQVVLKPKLSITLQGSGSVVVSNGPWSQHCTASCTVPMDPLSVYEVQALPLPGATFVSWDGACTGGGAVCDVSSLTAASLTASFTVASTLTVSVSGNGTGRIASNDGRIQCTPTCSETLAPGTLASLVATPAAGSVFVGWSGACSGTLTTCSVTVSGNVAVGASFGVPPPAGGSGGGGKGGGALDLATLAALAALAAGRWARRCSPLARAAGGGRRQRSIARP